MTIKTAAELADYSIRQFRRFMVDYPIPRVRIGRTYFIRGCDFNEWARHRSTNSKSLTT